MEVLFYSDHQKARVVKFNNPRHYLVETNEGGYWVPIQKHYFEYIEAYREAVRFDKLLTNI